VATINYDPSTRDVTHDDTDSYNEFPLTIKTVVFQVFLTYSITSLW